MQKRPECPFTGKEALESGNGMKRQGGPLLIRS